MFNLAISRDELKHSLDFETPMTEDCLTLKNTEEGRVEGPKVRGKEKTQELRL